MKIKTDYNIEALRGFCAIMVLLGHCINLSGALNNGYDLRTIAISYAPPGHMMVLVFFMLSGYVIGLTSVYGTEFSVLGYLKRRAVRLYPIYIFSILITVCFFNETWKSIVGTTLFTQNLFSNVLMHNEALWSLNHEVIYYLLAIPIIKINLKPKNVFGILLIALMISIKIKLPAIFDGYIVGFIFWITGFVISKIKLMQDQPSKEDFGKLISAFFLLLTADYLNTTMFVWSKLILHKFHITNGLSLHSLDSLVNINDFGYYLLSLYALCIAASIGSKWIKPFTLVIFLSAWVNFLYIILNGSFFKENIFYLPGLFLILSTSFYFFKKARSIPYWAKAGSISYAIYVIHTPILLYVGTITFFSGTTLSYFVRVIIVICVVALLSFLLEKRLQPQLRKYFFKDGRPKLNTKSSN